MERLVMPWAKQYNENEVLDRAMDAFWARGYEATSINALVEATGLNRGSLYTAFDDKKVLFLRSLEHYDRLHRRDFLEAMTRDHAPREAILEAFRSVVEQAREGTNRKGCLLVNTALEMSPHDPEIDRVIQASLETVEDFFRTMIEQAQEAGTIPAERDDGQTAQHLFGLFLGLRVITRSRPDAALMATIVSQAEALLD